MIENNILGIILAGGKSSRFGEDKSIAKLGDKTLLDHTINKICLLYTSDAADE